MPQDRFYLTAWTPEGDGETRKLMERAGTDDGGDAVTAEFSRYPAPLGEQLADTALSAANAYAEANPNSFAPVEE
ncbi:hypothetical protein FV226_13195 [Methylobacterium sp. WL12]|uniref:hypothetical protein n=1 Tax=Methylobacterium sp. WL12 TaxID=2603890 RepID=UPI0011C8F5C0|nr:hypothetical protein [Methylobacterium sp. WL12]TXM72179.1 hypothetical protein FV226_13195 [Methylobacterium sp. WL12]